MNLSKTAKRFLSSTMAIALAGGSVLAFGNSASAVPDNSKTETSDVGFTGAVQLECELEAGGTAPVNNYSYTTDTTDNTYDNTLTDPGEDRAEALSATQSINYDCNSAAVDITVTNGESSYTAPTGAGASALTATHAWAWGKGDATTATTAFTLSSGDATLATDEVTDANGDIQVSIKSTWTADGEELFAANDYTATLDLVVTAK